MKTKRGIDYDLEVYSFDGRFVCLAVTCENGTTDIYQGVTESERNAYIKTNDVDYLNLNFDEIERWVDATEISWAVSEVTKVCLMNGWNLYYNSNDSLEFVIVKNQGSPYSIVIELESLEQVNDWLCMNK